MGQCPAGEVDWETLVRSIILAATLALAAVPVGATTGDSPVWLLGRICHGEAPPAIVGPHRLVMVAGMGDDHMDADTRSVEAQRWFDYGLTLGRSFEHADAALAFQRAEATDPSCSLCVAGEAWARGPTINFGVSPEQTAADLALAKHAQALAGPQTTAPMRRFEAALVDRYQAGGDLRYARDLDAMNRASPDNVETAAFDAEAWLIMEWVGDPSGPTRAVAVLAPLVPRHSDVSGLVHFYIHATEDAGVPEQAEAYAPRLAELAPSASHMVHMPSHTYFRVGRYEDAALANVAALKVDRAYAEKTSFPTPLGGLLYHFHNVRFGLGGALMAGDAKTGLALVRLFNQDFPAPASYDPRAAQAAGETYAALGRLAPPAEILSAPDTVASNPQLEAMRHYARGEAYLRLGDARGLAREAEALGPAPAPEAAQSTADIVASIARDCLAGDLAMLRGHPAEGARRFAAAAALQDARLAEKDDPPRWWFPVRRNLGAALLAEGDAAGAKRETDTVLASWKLDPVTLAIRAAAERRLGESAAAASDRASARRRWLGEPGVLAGRWLS
jgi:hypothetical protein